MIALKQILVPTDFSDAAGAAVRYGVAFARAFNARLSLLHVVEQQELEVMVERQRVVDTLLASGPAAASGPGIDQITRQAARELLGHILTAQEQEDVRGEYLLCPAGLGGPYLEIVRCAKERDIDLIVMGTHGRGFVAHMVMGSVAERVVRNAPCPVLTVRHPEHEFVIDDRA